MIDTHAHLDKVLKDSQGEVNRIILAGSDIKDSKKNIKLAKKYNFLLAAVGIHPQSSIEKVKQLEKLIDENVIAIGECGLDFAGDHNQRKQENVFIKQIELAKKYNLPLIIHARKAVDEVIKILNKYEGLRGVFHCYAGGKKRIKKVLELGFYIGIDGNLTYEEGLADVVKNVPEDKLLLETDTPYLTPLPFRGEKNKPAYIKYTYEKVSEIWKKSFEETESIIDKNAKKLFNIF
jgi:TatD DNase family protein